MDALLHNLIECLWV